VIKHIRRLKDDGIIRRIGGNFVPEKLGFVSTLCAAKVPEDKIDVFAAAVNRYPGVTHNYQRDNEFNIWFTFIAPSMEDIEKNLKDIAAETGVTGILNLPATRVYKIKAQFDL
jgi:DNA-binding Lrp family transcriptional regulator